ncbi:hypothetical protein [Microbacterium thalassium]|uniref:DUF4230 domain-containing protein n=1 Tax=Microbacterium thalassium TaxID=362649 RepID=A0A7X0FM24_9MICO|nr:hypothetical protein [Microbacterium thalassium]MBB6389993.1 hypothetical protein [Microbacterium thalassium]GLK24679.1 hypothetical protein GCM10017607_19970 [Microbacterium thalassium]
MKFLKKPVPLWSHFATFGIVVLVVGALVAGLAVGLLTPPWVASALGPQTVVRNEQVVTSIERKEQPVLLQLGVQGISTAEGIPPAFFKDLPWLQKARLMQYSMKVKLGVDSVEIKSTADHEFLVTVPQFIWIGVDDLKIDRVFSDDGVLSAFTPQDSESEQFNEIVDDELKQQYLDDNLQLLRDQAEFYFTQLAKSIDPDAELTFEFAQ